MKKILPLLLVALICAGLIAGCDSGSKAQLSVWCSELDKEIIESMVAAFMETKPSIKGVNVVVCEDDSARQKFEDDPKAAADVICIPHDQLGALVEGGGILEITGSGHLGAIDMNTAPSVKAGQFRGKQYGFPSSFETHMLFYDKSLIPESSVHTLEGITSIAVPEGGYTFAMEMGNAYFSANWFFTYGCMLFGESGEDAAFCDFNSAEGVAAMTYLIENRDKLGNCNSDEAADLFSQHKLGAYVGGPWDAEKMTAVLKGNYGCTRLPGVGGKPMRSFAGFKLYCVNANTKNKDVAMDLAAWLSNPDNQKVRFLNRNLSPVAKSLEGDADVEVSTTVRAVVAQGPHSIAMPSIPQMSNFWTPTGGFTAACYNGDISTADLGGRLNELVAEILS